MTAAASRMRRQIFVLFALTTLPLAAFAEAADHLHVQEPARPDVLPAKPGVAFELPPVPRPATSAAPIRGGGVQVDRILFRGNAAIDGNELAIVAAPYAGRRLDAADLEELRQKITRHYIEHGYVNSGARLGPGAVADGTVTFDIVEGRLSALRMRGLERLDENYVAQRLARNSSAALNVDALRESFQLLLDDPLFERMNARLMPDTQLGEAILDVDVVRARPYQLMVFANNYRPPSIGANAYGLSGWVRNLTGYGDVLEAGLQDSLQGGNGGRTSLGWRIPLNYSGTLLTLQYDHGRSSVIEEPMQALDIRSTLTSKDIGVSQAFESLRHKLMLGINRVARENRTTLLGAPFSFTPGEPEGVTRENAWRFWQEYTYRSERQVLVLRSILTSGRNNLQDAVGLPPDAAAIAERSYRVWLGQAQYVHQLLDGAQFVVRANVQETSHVLLPLDRMSIGGVGTVRGYRENQLVRDTGTVVNVEFDYPLLRGPGKEFNMNVIPFYDHGRGKNRREEATTLSSWGLASRMRWQKFSLDVAVAKRLVHPDSAVSSGGTLQDKGIHLQLAYSFF